MVWFTLSIATLLGGVDPTTTRVLALFPEPETHCPTGAVVARALQARAFQISQDDRVPAWILRYGTTARPGAPATELRIDLSDNAGEGRLHRKVDIGAASCGERAEVVAAIVERYFADVGWTTGAPLPTSHPRATASEETQTRLPRLRLAAGPALYRADAWSWVATLDARVRLVGPLIAGIGLLGLPGMMSQPLIEGGRAEISTIAWPVRASVALGQRLGPRASIEGGCESLFSFETGRTVDTAMTGIARRLVVGLGVGTLASLRLGRHWLLQAEVTLYRSLGSEFTVDTASADQHPRYVFLIPAWRGLASVRLAYAVWP